MKRPKQHVTGDKGIAGVLSACYECGWACDVVHSDYGEDLVVQTCLRDEVDAFRTLVQVKSRSKRRKTYSRVSVSREHGLRWCRSREPVVLILWDAEKKCGVFILPKFQLNEHSLLSSEKPTCSIDFNDALPVNKENLERLGWHLRLSYFEDRLLQAGIRDAEYDFARKENLTGRAKYRSEAPTIMFDLFCRLDIIQRSGVAPHMSQWFHNSKQNIKRNTPAGEKRPSASEAERMAAMLCFYGQLDKIGAGGAPLHLAESATNYLLMLLKSPSRTIEKPK